MKRWYNWILIVSAIFLWSCSGGSEGAKEIDSTGNVKGNPTYAPPYSFNKPDKIFNLPEDLNEISGIAYFNDSIILAIQDELGKLYIFNHQIKKVTGAIPFGDNGDYEGMTLNGNDVFIIESNGKINMINDLNLSRDSVESVTIDSKLSKDGNYEGIFFNTKTGEFLIASKDDFKENKKFIYVVEFKGDEFEREGTIEIDLEDVENSLMTTGFDKLSLTIKKSIDPSEDLGIFRPSDLAIHPITGHLYVLSAKHNLLLIMNNNGQIIYVHPFSNKIFHQPEGIAFSPGGDLFISNEVGGNSANILKFNYEK